jgi:hypothetical protein
LSVGEYLGGLVGRFWWRIFYGSEESGIGGCL